jgi:hypothetical protein
MPQMNEGMDQAQPEILGLRDSLAAEVESLENVVCDLEERLTQVLTDEPPEAGNKLSSQATKDTSTRLGGALQDLQRGVTRARDRLRMMLHRLEV